jgi:hypothetical protein
MLGAPHPIDAHEINTAALAALGKSKDARGHHGVLGKTQGELHGSRKHGHAAIRSVVAGPQVPNVVALGALPVYIAAPEAASTRKPLTTVRDGVSQEPPESSSHAPSKSETPSSSMVSPGLNTAMWLPTVAIAS